MAASALDVAIDESGTKTSTDPAYVEIVKAAQRLLASIKPGVAVDGKSYSFLLAFAPLVGGIQAAAKMTWRQAMAELTKRAPAATMVHPAVLIGGAIAATFLLISLLRR